MKITFIKLPQNRFLRYLIYIVFFVIINYFVVDIFNGVICNAFALQTGGLSWKSVRNIENKGSKEAGSLLIYKYDATPIYSNLEKVKDKRGYTTKYIGDGTFDVRRAYSKVIYGVKISKEYTKKQYVDIYSFTSINKGSFGTHGISTFTPNFWIRRSVDSMIEDMGLDFDQQRELKNSYHIQCNRDGSWMIFL